MTLLLLAFLSAQTESPPNTWVTLKPVMEQPKDPSEQGTWNNAGWNKLVYDAAAKRVLFYDRWFDSKHGGYTIYGNCLFAFDPATSRLAPLKISNWTRVKDQHYRTVPLPENDLEPSPCDRHVYHAFDLVPDLRAVVLCNGANQAAAQGEIKGHDVVHNTWSFDLEKGAWSRIESKEHPQNDLEDGMAYAPETKSIIYAGHGKIWILNLASGQWRKAKKDLPRDHMGMTVFHDPPRKRLLLVGGGSYDRMDSKEAGFNAVYAFDPATEELAKLADSPVPHCRGALAYDSKRDLFFSVANFESKSGTQASGMFRYDPKADAWSEVKCENGIPMRKSFGQAWMPLCYDAANDQLLGIAGPAFHAFRYAPPK
ncbi:MAG: hypothetical protein HY293_21880 [Planctomycetes bacterium]|nr:hypothetical protein [Planctomycetota bacterium]